MASKRAYIEQLRRIAKLHLDEIAYGSNAGALARLKRRWSASMLLISPETMIDLFDAWIEADDRAAASRKEKQKETDDGRSD